MMVVRKGRLDIVQCLVSYGANVNKKDAVRSVNI
jgi:hypothetical protein